MSFNAGDLKWGQRTLGTESGEITWSFDPDLFDDLVNSSGSDAAFENSLENAFQVWEDVADVNFTQVNFGTSADVLVGAGALSGNIAGQAGITFTGNAGLSQILSGTVTFDNELSWTPTGAGGIDFEAVAIHEVGHILGLGHVNDVNQILNPVVSTDELGNGDIAGVQFLYGLSAGDVPAAAGAQNLQDDPQVFGLTGDDDVDADPVSGGGAEDGGGAGGAIGILLGLLAALLGLSLGAGGGVGVALAAGSVPDMDGDEDEEGDTCGDDEIHFVGDGHDHSHDIVELDDGSFEFSHNVFVDDLGLPSVGFDEAQNPCGCYGPCEHHLEDAEVEMIA